MTLGQVHFFIQDNFVKNIRCNFTFLYILIVC